VYTLPSLFGDLWIIIIAVAVTSLFSVVKFRVKAVYVIVVFSGIAIGSLDRALIPFLFAFMLGFITAFSEIIARFRENH
jgi:hypothetical protein